MPRIFLTQTLYSGKARVCYLVSSSKEEVEAVEYYLYPISNDEDEMIELKRASHPARGPTPLAMIRFDSWTISLEIFSNTYIHTHGWGPNDYSGDVFQIGGVILEIHREASEKPGIELDTIRSLTVASDCAGGKRKRANSGTRDEIESVTCGADTMSLINPKYQQFNKQTIGQNLFKAPEKFLTQRSSDGSTTLVLCENSLPSGRTRVRVFFACSPSIGKTSKAMSLLERKGLLKVNSVEDCDLLCIGQGDLRKKDCDLFCIAKGDVKKICNLVLAVISGKDVVTDDWLEHSIQRSELLYHGSFLAQEPSKELRWDFCLSEAIERGRRALKPLTGYGFYFTPAAAKALGTSFFAVQEIGIQAGAEIVQGSLPRSLCRRDVEKTIHIGAGSDDEDLEELVEGEWRVYSLEFLTTSALRAWIDAESNEFLIRPRGCCELCGAIKKRGNKEYSLRLR